MVFSTCLSEPAIIFISANQPTNQAHLLFLHSPAILLLSVAPGRMVDRPGRAGCGAQWRAHTQEGISVYPTRWSLHRSPYRKSADLLTAPESWPFCSLTSKENTVSWNTTPSCRADVVLCVLLLCCLLYFNIYVNTYFCMHVRFVWKGLQAGVLV